DSHLSERAPECVSNWRAAASAVAAADPDLTIHLGDITLDGCEQPEELPFARGLVQAWPTPMVCTPGNHDMGTGSGEKRLSRAGCWTGRCAVRCAWSSVVTRTRHWTSWPTACGTCGCRHRAS